jgi:hypothetical protein
MDIKLNDAHVWYARIASIIFLIGILPGWTFYLGIQYAQAVDSLRAAEMEQASYVSPTHKVRAEKDVSIATSTVSGVPLTITLSSCGAYDVRGCFGSGATLNVSASKKGFQVYELVSTETAALFGVDLGEKVYLLSFDTGIHSYSNDEYLDYLKKVPEMFSMLKSSVAVAPVSSASSSPSANH